MLTTPPEYLYQIMIIIMIFILVIWLVIVKDSTHSAPFLSFSVSHIIVDDFKSTFFFLLICLFSQLCGNLFIQLFYMPPPQHFNQIYFCTLTEPLQHIDSFRFQAFFHRFDAVLWIIVLLRDPVSSML